MRVSITQLEPKMQAKVKRQPGSKNYGIFINDVMVEGGFFSMARALEAAHAYDDADSRLPSLETTKLTFSPSWTGTGWRPTAVIDGEEVYCGTWCDTEAECAELCKVVNGA